MSLVIATACIDGKFQKLKYDRITVKNHKYYAAIYLSSKMHPNMKVKQSKVIFVFNLLNSYERVFFTDCDSLFMNFSMDITHFVCEATYELIIS